MKTADENFEGEHSSETEIKALIAQIEPKIEESENEKFTHSEYLTTVLQQYKQEDMTPPTSQKIIKEIREFKYRIVESILKLKDIEALMKKLATELFNQDVSNASNLIYMKNQKLRERL